MYETVKAERLEAGMDLCGLGKLVKVTAWMDTFGNERLRLWFGGGKSVISKPSRKFYARIMGKTTSPVILTENHKYLQILRGLRR